MTVITATQSNVAELVARWGSSAAISLLDPNCQIFSIPEVDGVIGYRPISGCNVVYGEPVASPDDRDLLVSSFHSFSELQNKPVIYLTVCPPFKNWAMDRHCGALIEIGMELIVDPQNDLAEGSKGRIIRKKMNHSEKMGVSIKEYIPYDPDIELEIANVTQTWLKHQSGPKVIASQARPFEPREGKRWFYALCKGKIVGALIMTRLDFHSGWLVYLLMITPDAPNGTSERLIVSAVETLRKENCRFLSFGVSPSKELGDIIGLGRASSWIARKVFKTATKYFDVHGAREYWLKFQPSAVPSYFLFSASQLGLKEVYAIIKGFNGSI